MSRIKTQLTWLSALALSLNFHLIAADAGRVKVGDAFPDLGKFKLEGKLPDSLRGRVVLVDFWASWCGPCKASFPIMEELHKRYASQGLVVLAINVDQKKADMEEFLTKHTASFPIVRDAGQKLVKAVNVSTMPTSFLLDTDGKVKHVHNGFHGAETQKAYVQEIEGLLKSLAMK